MLATDGIFDCLSDEQVVAMILEKRPPSPEEASPLALLLSKSRGHSSLPPSAQQRPSTRAASGVARFDSPQAARLVVDEATRRGSGDDKTCTVVYFGWRSDLFASPAQAEEEEGRQGSQGAGGAERGEALSDGEVSASTLAEEKTGPNSLHSEKVSPPAASLPEKEAQAEGALPLEESVSVSGGNEALAARGLDDIASRTSTESVESIIRKRRREELEEARKQQQAEEEVGPLTREVRQSSSAAALLAAFPNACVVSALGGSRPLQFPLR